MARKVGNKVHQKGGPTLVQEAAKLGDSIKWHYPSEKKFWDRWRTEKYGGVKAMMGKQIGGQIPMRGPDILKFIKQHDSDNSSGAVKNALDIMLKLQDGSTKPKDLYTSIQPLQNILGSSLYGKMQSAASAAKASEKVQEAEPQKDMLAALINAALECAGPEAASVVAELLDNTETRRIDQALDSGSNYTPANQLIPQAFVDCVNKSIPSFYAIQVGATG